MDGPASHDGRSVLSSTPAQRAHKQRASMAATRVSHAPTFSAAGQGITTMRGSGSAPGTSGQGDTGKTRRGSIRHAVRKIFGRSSRDGAPRSPQVSAPVSAPLMNRHVYHKSEPTAALQHQPLPELPYSSQADDIVPQTILTTHIRAKTSSPYAVSFPKSVMLKPMNLGNPFVPEPGQMKRRKTMPSTGLSVRDAADAAATVPLPTAIGVEAIPEQDIRHARRALSQIKKARRKSRSTDDLVGPGLEPSPHRERNDEIRYWRESFQPDVIRASGFTTRTMPAEDSTSQRTAQGQAYLADDEQTPVPPATETFESARDSLSSRGSITKHREVPTGKEESRPSSPLELSKDLEQRVLKLEAGLNSFQRSLERLTADRNRRTIVLQSTMTTRRSSNDMRTPSMLADTLVDSLEPSSYEYEYGRTLRPSPSPKQSRSHYDDPFRPLTPRSDHYADSVTLPTPPHSRSTHHSPAQPLQSLPASLPPSSADSSRQQQYTFNSVYQMLSDERMARQKLESQLKHLQQEISDLHTQVNGPSQRSNDRNSYMLVGSSARLQQLLQETEEATMSKRSSGQTASGAIPVNSRFSGSESEMNYQNVDEAETPYGAYLTPREERSARSLADSATTKEDDLDCMF